MAAVEPAGDGDMGGVMRSAFPFFFFSRLEKKAIIQSIRSAEQKTSAEIRVHLERRVQGDVLDNAQKTFLRLGMNTATEKNAVLIFFETSGRRFAVIGGQAIHERAPQGFWHEQAARMETAFQQDCFADGVIEFVDEIGAILARHFPCKKENANEFPDQISYSL